MKQIPVLTYHSINVHGNDYHNNDHIALAADLRLIHRLGKRVVPLLHIAEWVRGERGWADVADGVGISFDDGSWFDWFDLDHPSWGPQRSLFNILMDFRDDTGADIHATSFVIASPDARRELDQTCMVGRGWWDDSWWHKAQVSGHLDIANHSWDHLHPTLERVAHSRQEKDNFHAVDNLVDAQRQIAQAGRYIESICRQPPALFAYPWGQAASFVSATYLPEQGPALGLRAAFTTQPAKVGRSSAIWTLPRYTFGADWQEPEQLRALLSQ